MFQKVLVAIDDSDMSQYVVDEAVSLATTNNSNLMLLHVLNPLDEHYIDGILIQTTMISRDDQVQNNQKYIDWERFKEKRLKWLGSEHKKVTKLGVAAEYNQHIGEASRSICDVARRWGADLIIMGRRGRRGLSEFFLGSVSNYVLHHAPCSVLIVQGPIKGSINPTGKTDEEVSQTEKLETQSTI